MQGLAIKVSGEAANHHFRLIRRVDLCNYQVRGKPFEWQVTTARGGKHVHTHRRVFFVQMMCISQVFSSRQSQVCSVNVCPFTYLASIKSHWPVPPEIASSRSHFVFLQTMEKLGSYLHHLSKRLACLGPGMARTGRAPGRRADTRQAVSLFHALVPATSHASSGCHGPAPTLPDQVHAQEVVQ